MRKGWKEYKLGELVDLKQGFALNKKSNHYLSNDNSGLPLLKISDLIKGVETLFVKENIPKQFLVTPSEIIYSRTGQVGLAFMGKTGVVYNNCFKVIPSEKIYSVFLFQWLNNPKVRNIISSLATGTAQADLNHDAFKSVKIILPPLRTQNKIASILSSYDNLIKNNLKRINLLEEKAQLTYEEWFVKMRFPGYETAKFDEVIGLFEGWEKKEFQFFGQVITGKTPSTRNELFFDGNIPFVKTPDMAGFPYVLDCTQKLSKLGANSQKNKFIPKNSLMISCIGSAGAFALASEDCQTNQQINSIIFNEEYYTFFFYCLAKGLKPILEGLGSNGATMTNVNKGKFEKIEAVCPPIKLLLEFHNLIKDNFEVILSLQKQNRLLKEARNILLPRLMSGMIDVEELELETKIHG